VVCRGTFSFLKETVNPDTKEVTTSWESEEISTINLIASNPPKLGIDHPISPRVSGDDGKICVTMLDSSFSRTQTVQTALAMKKVRD